MNEERLVRVIEDFNPKNLDLFFRSKCDNYAEDPENLNQYSDERFRDFHKLGEIRFDTGEKLIVASSLVKDDLTERSGKKAQYEKAKNILKDQQIYDAGFLIFHDDSGSFRFSLIYAQFQGVKRTFSNFRRYTYFVSPKEPYRTFLIRVGDCNYSSLETIKDAFSVEKVNKEFYGHVARFFYRLTGYNHPREMQLPSVPDEDKKTYQEFAVRLIGRAIFCWFLKHKRSPNGESLIPESILSSEAVRQNSQYYHSVLEKLFFEVLNAQIKERKGDIFDNADKIPFLNGGLFEPHKDDFYPSKPLYNLVIPDSWFEQFFEILEQYNFTIDENSTIDADVSVDPEMLGRIFENLLAEVNPETGETARKATGSYYTPRTIVDYMVDQSLRQYLVTKTNISEDKIASLLSYEAEDVSLTDAEKDSVISALDEIKIIDPACGSGAFPMGILHKMLLVLQKVDPDLRIWLRNHLGKIEPGIFRDRLLERIKDENWEYVRKLLIIQNAIYGVDIQTIAVEISKLRFFLSLIVDEKIEDAKENRGVEALPNLEFKFVAANTLIGLPPVINRQVGLGVGEETDRLRELRDRYLRSYGREKKEIEEDFLRTRGKLIEQNIDWGGKDALALQLANWDPFSNEACEWFDPEWMFDVEDGFDIVIANPPYVNISNISKDDREAYKEMFSITKNKVDLYAYFIEKGNGLLKQTSTLCYIVPHTWKATSSFEKLREFIFRKFQLKSIVEMDYGVFETTVKPIVIVLTKPININEEYKIMVYDHNFKIINTIPIREVLDSHNYSIDTISSSNEKILFGNIECQSIKLEYILKFTRGIKTSNDARFIKNLIENSDCKKVIRGKDVKKYLYVWNGEYVWYRPDLMKEKVGCLPHNKELFEVNDKIILQRISKGLVGCLDSSQIYALDTCLVSDIKTLDSDFSLKYILALINSNVLNFWYQKKFVLPTVSGYELEQLPIKHISELEQGIFIDLVDQILTITKDEDYLSNSTKQAKVKEYECQIDQMVYELYGLTPEEIEIVEGKK